MKLTYNFSDHSKVALEEEPSFIQSLWKQNRVGSNKSNEADAFYDILIPTLIIVSLFIVNACILFVIWRLRIRRYVI